VYVRRDGLACGQDVVKGRRFHDRQHTIP
jgi:hypothetical protein